MERSFVIFTAFQANDLLQFGAYFHLQLKPLLSGSFAVQRSPGQCAWGACAEVPDVAPSFQS